jgi:HSP20 family protein
MAPQNKETRGQGDGSRAMQPRESERRHLPASWSPFGMMDTLAEEMERMFGDIGLMPWSRRGRLATQREGAAWWPPIEVEERDGELHVKADLPGVRKEDVDIEVTPDALILRGERRQSHEEREEGFYRSECSYGSFQRAIPLPEGADPDKAKATFQDGVLEVTLPAPKREERSRSRRIEIQGGGKRP